MRDKLNYGELDPGPPISREEIRKAVYSMKWGKAEGIDEVAFEMVEAAGEFEIGEIIELANRIYRTGHVPKTVTRNLACDFLPWNTSPWDISP